MSELRAAYKSAVSKSPPSAAEFFPDPSSLSVPGFVAFARRRGVCGADLTVAQMARLIKPAWFAEERRMTHETETKRYPVEALNQSPTPPDPEPSVATTAAADAAETFFLDPRYASAAEKDDLAERPLNAADPRETPDALSPNATLAFREFVECLVRCAHAKFLATPGLHRRVEALFRESAFVDDADATPWDALMASEDVQRVLRGELVRGDDRKSTDGDALLDHTTPAPRGSLHSCFVACSRIRQSDPTRRRDPPAVDGRAFLAFLVDARVVADADDDGEEVSYPPPEPTPSANEPTDGPDADEPPDANDEGPDDTDDTDLPAAEISGAKPEDSAVSATTKNQAVGLTALQALSAFAAAVAPRDALLEARARAEADEAEAEAAALAAYEAEAEREARREAAAARKAEREAAKREAAEAAEAAGEDAAAALDAAAGADDDDDEDEDAGVSEAELAAAAEAEAKAKAAKKLDVQTQALTRVLDCEATFPEFAEALARCADVAIVGDERSLSLAEKLDAFFGELST
jgi:hypothetical protein